MTPEHLSRLPVAAEITPEALPEAVLQQYLDCFFDLILPMIPFFTREWITERIQAGLHLRQRSFFALILSISSLAMIQPALAQRAPDLFEDALGGGYVLHMQASKLHDAATLEEGSSIYSLYTSYFLFSVLVGLGKPSSALLRLREAISIAELLQLNNSSSYLSTSEHDMISRASLYWTLCVLERVLAINHGRAIVFTGSISRFAATLSAAQLQLDPGLHILTRFLDSFQGEVLTCLTGKCPVSKSSNSITFHVDEHQCQLGTAIILTIQRYLTVDLLSDAFTLSALRLVDLLVTLHWLKLKIWQLALSHGLLQEDAIDKELRLDYAISDIGQSMLCVVQTFPRIAWEANGVSLCEKLFDVATTVAQLLQGYSLKSDMMMDSDACIKQYQAKTVLTGLAQAIATFKLGTSPYSPLVQGWLD